MGSQVGARWGLATLTISTRKIWYNWTIPPNQFLGEIRNKKKIRHCGKNRFFFHFVLVSKTLSDPRHFPEALIPIRKKYFICKFYWILIFLKPETGIIDTISFQPFFSFSVSPETDFCRMIRCISVFFLRTPSHLTEMDWPEQRRRKIDFRFCFKLKLSLKKYF